MQLRSARLCLDCEEIHVDQQCPVCLSEAFVYLTRWVPAEERRTQRLPAATKVTPEKSAVARWAQRGVVGLAVAAAAGRWWWEANRPPASPDGEKGSRNENPEPSDGINEGGGDIPRP